ncbi:hypothetical protein LWF01_10720 [Saxibacter everestensis]|uniref:Uncharacterized protein n=1 Tax=Saxibacter everestensis TaxID=2909229 RepID=A0ABY8QP59_9MICO|nr:hypothetical protein LWF01_10720 [Brevibacteriaceae bacterium ZFBP1038]
MATSAIQRRYTAGVVTALTVMLPGASIAQKELMRVGVPLRMRDYAAGAAILIPAAIVCHLLARTTPSNGGFRLCRAGLAQTSTSVGDKASVSAASSDLDSHENF